MVNPQLNVRKRRYLDTIYKEINDNPERFLDLDTPSERPREAKRKQLPTGGGRFGPRRAPTETEEAFWSGVGDTFSFGLNDEAAAGLSALGAAFDDRDMGDVYDRELERARAEAAYLEERHPYAYGAGNVVGAVVNPATYLPIGAVARAGMAMRYLPNAGKLAQTSLNMAVGGAIDGGVYGFNSGEGGLQNRAQNAALNAEIGAATGAVAPYAVHGLVQAGKVTARELAEIIGPFLDEPTRRIIGNIAQTPEEAAALMERALYLRRGDVERPGASLPETVTTAYDLAAKEGQRLGKEMRVIWQALYGKGETTSPFAMTTPRMNRVGSAYLGPGQVLDKIDTGMISADGRLRYREPKLKENPHPSNLTGIQANLERELKKVTGSRRVYRNNLHVNIAD